VEIREITGEESKTEICDRILRSLPEWFGIEESIVDYVRQVREMPFYAALDGGEEIGFLAVKTHNPFAAEVCVMGVLRQHHRKGAGMALVKAAEDFCRAKGHEYLTVKTLAGSVSYEPYSRTRMFYEKAGFVPLEVFPLLWDERNPCLFMAKHIKCAKGQ
jgi:GNAT superfamily N-acetyltransferase